MSIVHTGENTIQNVLFESINHVAVIKSQKGQVRSNHYHVVSGHWLYVVSGKMEYAERNLDGSESTNRIVSAGEMVYTPPNKVHRTTFLADTVMINMSVKKSVEDYADDTVKAIF